LKDLYLKERKLGGRINHSKRGLLRPLFFLLLALGLIAAVVFYAPQLFRWPVSITINGVHQQVSYGTTLSRAAAMNISRDQLFGDLIAVDGEVYERFGGEPPVFTVRGSERDGDTVIRTRQTITVSRGADITEEVSEVEVEVEPELRRTGSGPFRHVVSAGQVGISKKKVGMRSGIELEAVEVTAPLPVEVVFSAYPEDGSPVIALTFDDGPHPVHTPALLDALAAEGVKATFFVTGVEVNRHPELARRIVDEGHQIANHSFGHRDYRGLSYSDKRLDFERAQDAIENASGVRPGWVRPPYGQWNASTMSLFGALDVRMANWNLDPVDWRRPGASTIADRVIERAKPGSVVLMHDGGGNREQTVMATRSIIQALRAQGYQFLTVEELYARTP